MSTEELSPSPLWDVEIIGGPEKRTIVLVESDPAWPGRFAAERNRIVDALGAIAARVDHIGSTAVPGLPAKPVIDIQVSVADVEEEDHYRPALEHGGYEMRAREPAHRMLRTPARDVHVHVCSGGSRWERRHLLFRDWLRTSIADQQLYARTKRQLAAHDWPTMDQYADAKTDVIAAIMGRAEAWARTVDWRLDRAL